MDEVATQCGVTSRALYYDMAAEGTISELSKFMAPLIKHTKREIRELALKELDKEMEKLGGAAVDAIKDALTGGVDPKTAAQVGLDVFRQLRGAPVLKMEQSGTVLHRHELFVMPKKTLRALGEDIEQDADLMQAARQLSAPQPQIESGDKAKAIDVQPI